MLAALLTCAVALAGDAPFWGDLDVGPYAVGFKSHWEFDAARTQRHSEAETARPVLVNVWYPALASGAPAMAHGDYFDVISNDPRIADFSRALVEYERGVLRDYVVGDVSDDELDAFLTTPTAARRDATPASGPFPVVQYHGGFGSSFDDNSVLCEYLASWGYVVIGSAYPRGDGTSFNIDAKDGSFRDLEFLLRHGTTLSYADASRSALIGHSGGAHTALEFAAHPNRAVDVLVAIDTTQDAHSLTDPRWRTMVDATLAGKAHIDQPMLFIAPPQAYFALADALTGSERTYLTVRDLDHDTLISQGTIHSDRTADDAEREHEASAEATRRNFRALCESIRLFLDANLADDLHARATLTELGVDRRVGGELPRIERVARGVGRPSIGNLTAGTIPTPRQVRPFLDAHGVTALVAGLREWREDPKGAVITSNAFLVPLLSDLVHAGRIEDARALFAFASEEDAGIIRRMHAWFDYYKSNDRIAYIDWFLDVTEALAPHDADVQRWRAFLDENARQR